MKKRILVTAYDLEIGGIERSLINMLEHFDYERFEVDLLLFSHTGDLVRLIPTRVNLLPENKRFSVFRKPLGQCLRDGQWFAVFTRLFCKYAAVWQARSRNLKEDAGYIQMQLIAKYVSMFLPKQQCRYDIAISYAWPHDYVADKVDADVKVGWIHTDYGELEIDNERDLKIWERFVHIASISEACTSSFVARYPTLAEKIVLVENINSPGFVKELADEAALPEEMRKDERQATFDIVSVGRLSFVKGFDLAIEALRLLHEKGYDDIRWFVVGYGGYEADLKRMIAAHRLQDSFRLVGKKSNPYPYIKACDLYVQPSRYEGKAVTVTEAQILHKPILITGYPTAHSQVEDGVDGRICELSAEGIAQGIEALYLDEEERRRLVRNVAQRDYGNSHELKKLYRVMARGEGAWG
ncbi:glycosyltransferase [Paenibacillus antri]|uniref:Glycosyltransferase n=1 Tax=Paenibacillus antri TaxID=2582848 RepID=A0A5R9GDE8_9BACL|nr:glycosyltransferase [Paenibacillus antri]TLS49405.1 glycosyltransferase [Paenibacillus antri]